MKTSELICQIQSSLARARPRGWKRCFRRVLGYAVPLVHWKGPIGHLLRRVKIWGVRRYFEESAPFLSQYGQDVIAMHLLRDKQNLSFLDIGAHDGVSYSNTCALERLMGGSGVCIEPNPQIFAKLEQCRSARCFQCAVGGESAPELEFVAGSGSGSMLSHIAGSPGSKGKLRRLEVLRETKTADYAVVRIPSMTISQILEEAEMETADFISIDVEGAELEILRQLDLVALKTRVLTVEANEGDPLGLIALITDQGFRLYAALGDDLVFVSP